MSIKNVNVKSALSQPKSEPKSKYTFTNSLSSNGFIRHEVKVEVKVPSVEPYCMDTATLEVSKYPDFGTVFYGVTIVLHVNGHLRYATFTPHSMREAWEEFKEAVALIGGVL